VTAAAASVRAGTPSWRMPWGWVVAAILGVVLAASIAGNALLVQAAFEGYKGTNAIRLDPVGLAFYEKDRAHPPSGRPLLVFFGDSRALMWGRPNVPGYTVANRGIGWQTTAQILGRIDRDLIPLHPDVVVVEAGVNDLKTVAEFPERRAQIIADCEANLTTIVEDCRRVGATVVLSSVFEVGHVPLWKRPFWSDDVAVAIREVNTYLGRLAGDHVVIFDANPALDDGHGEVQRPFQLDYLHLNEGGYDALNRKILPIFAGLPR
jgi:lysophospholipase L1-like esterase